jgi:hypothetical protein
VNAPSRYFAYRFPQSLEQKFKRQNGLPAVFSLSSLFSQMRRVLGNDGGVHGSQNHGNVVTETAIGGPSKGEIEKMARRRFQAPKPKRRGKWWCLLYWQDEFVDGRRIRKRKRINLAPADMPEREVNKIAAEQLRPMNQGLVTLGSATNFAEFVDTVYIPVLLPNMAKTTQGRYGGIIDNYLKPHFQKLCLRDISVLTVDRYLTSFSTSTLSHESIDKIRDVLSGILSAAVRYELLVRNPAEGLKLPRVKKGKRSKPFIIPDQFSALMELTAEPYATMVYVAVYTGLRVSELIGLRWRNVGIDSIAVERDIAAVIGGLRRAMRVMQQYRSTPPLSSGFKN